jgi:hypothetical protein
MPAGCLACATLNGASVSKTAKKRANSALVSTGIVWLSTSHHGRVRAHVNAICDEPRRQCYRFTAYPLMGKLHRIGQAKGLTRNKCAR